MQGVVGGGDPGHRPGALVGRRRGERRVGAGPRGRRRRNGRQHELLADARRGPAGGRRGQSARPSKRTAGSSPTPTARPCRWSSPLPRSTGRWGSSGSSSRPTSPYRGPVDVRCDELEAQTHALLHETDPPPAEIYPHRIAFNVMPQVETFKQGDDYTTEERKMMAETRKILGVDEQALKVSATCVRVPVLAGESESVNVQTREALSAEECRALLVKAPGVVVVDSPGDGVYPLASDAAGRDEILVGRIRSDPSHERCLNMWIVGDNLRKGAATNAVQLAELPPCARPHSPHRRRRRPLNRSSPVYDPRPRGARRVCIPRGHLRRLVADRAGDPLAVRRAGAQLARGPDRAGRDPGRQRDRDQAAGPRHRGRDRGGSACRDLGGDPPVDGRRDPTPPSWLGGGRHRDRRRVDPVRGEWACRGYSGWAWSTTTWPTTC